MPLVDLVKLPSPKQSGGILDPHPLLPLNKLESLLRPPLPVVDRDQVKEEDCLLMRISPGRSLSVLVLRILLPVPMISSHPLFKPRESPIRLEIPLVFEDLSLPGHRCDISPRSDPFVQGEPMTMAMAIPMQRMTANPTPVRCWVGMS